MNDNAAADFLLQQLQQQTTSIYQYSYQEQTVWIKKASPRHAAWVYWPLRGLAKLLRLDALMPVPNLGGAAAIETECQRLLHLHDHGIAVPRVFAFNQNGLMLSHVGTGAVTQLEALLMSADSAKVLDALQSAAEAIWQVHRAGCWLSEAFARNILQDATGRIWFVDFETDPAHWLSEYDCRIRDWMCVLFSVSMPLACQDILRDGCQRLAWSIQQEPLAVQQGVFLTCRRLRWLRRLPVAGLGRDGQRLAATAQALDDLSEILQAGL